MPRLGYQTKGYTDGITGHEYIKHVNKHTRDKAKSHWRVLLVDVHNSHYTQDFLKYARENRIHVLCYPAHGTHVYQGLDVAAPSVLKRYWAEERVKWLREKGESVSKQNFLAIYGAAHIRALKPEIILAAFRKTGVWPYDCSIVTSEMMAPSLETSRRATMPIVPPTPVRMVTELIRSASEPSETPITTSAASTLSTPSSAPVTSLISADSLSDPFTSNSPARALVSALRSTTARFLVGDSPVHH